MLCPRDHAKKYTDSYVKVSSVTQASDTLALSQREDITSYSATVSASRLGYKQVGITPNDIDVAEVHDIYTVSGIMALQDLGFFRRGEAGKAVADGQCSIGGKIAINTSGGLKSCGHPIGATGVAQIVEIVQQLRGAAGKRQVNNARYGLTQNTGGTGSAVSISILEAI